MKIGLDLSVIQTPHRMRGIGAVAINFMKNIPEEYKNNTFVLYLYQDGQQEALSILDLNGLKYEVRNIKKYNRIKLGIPRRLSFLESILTDARNRVYAVTGDPRIADTDLDLFLQFDQMQNLPRVGRATTGTILYDLIPYAMESDYLWNYKTARRNGKSRKGALRASYLRYKYISQAKLVAKKAKKLFAISHYTKEDYIDYTSISEAKISVAHLGVDRESGDIQTAQSTPNNRYVENPWGNFQRPINMEDKDFILFVGGADARRRLDHLIGAYNMLRAQGSDIRLVLAGDIMTGPNAIPSHNIQQSLRHSSYKEDIVFLGFVTEQEKNWLYAHALAMVYPSVYEGFGLPVLEAMQHGTPVITYDNTSIREIAEDAALYAHDATSIKNIIMQLLAETSLRAKFQKRGKNQSAKYIWTSTTRSILNKLSS